MIVAGSLTPLCAQDLAPRAYVITPVHWNAITLSDAFNDGDILLEGAAPVAGGTGKGHIPALAPAEYRNWQQKTLVGFSVKVVAPTGEYHPTKLINWGANRWAFRPELGRLDAGAIGCSTSTGSTQWRAEHLRGLP